MSKCSEFFGGFAESRGPRDLPELLVDFAQMEKKPTKLVLVIHGGAGVIKNLSEERVAAYKERLTASLKAGYTVLQEGKSAVEAVAAAIMVMENSELFNAGKGSVYTNLETIEMDASIMNGSNRNAGSVCAVQTIKNPITAAIAVMDKSEHVMLSSKGIFLEIIWDLVSHMIAS